MVIDDLETPFTFRKLMTTGEVYTFSCWAKASVSANIKIAGSTIALGTSWSKIELTFTAADKNLEFIFLKAGTYFFYHSQLEFGNVATDWSPSPDDVRDEMQEEVDKVQSELDETKTAVNSAMLDIDSLKGAISALVAGENGETLLTQTDNGWVFSMAGILNNIDGVNQEVDALKEDLTSNRDLLAGLNSNVEKYDTYIRFITKDGHPAIELGKDDSLFKVLITNEKIEFIEGTDSPAHISNQSLNITKAVVTEELQQGGYIWRVESNNSYSLIWKGV